jgi:hypothetical protein
MRDPLLLLLPVFLAATRSLAFAIQWPSKDGLRPTISAATEYQVLLVVIFCLTGLLVTLALMVRFPNFGAEIAELNQF